MTPNEMSKAIKTTALELAAKPQGFCAPELLEAMNEPQVVTDIYAVRRALRDMQAKGLLHKATRSNKPFVAHYCSSVSAANDWSPVADTRRLDAKKEHVNRAFVCNACGERPIRKMVDAAGNKVVIPPGLMVQRIAAPVDSRYLCAPGQQPQGAGFSAAGIGRYLDSPEAA